jgi:Lrp/AsnC family transcriptional regulator for asnA, asnC and gidA
MTENYQIDNVDRQILNELLLDARIPYLEIARKLIVSGGTIHQRIDKLKKMGVLEGSKAVLNLSKLGYDVTVILGIHLKSSRDLNDVIGKLEQLPEIVEAHYTTGNYALLLKLHTKTIQDFHKFLANKLQAIDAIQSTESFISLSQPINRDVKVLQK